ncbi:three-helix bundle dimerization domain-containing protein [Krasilnikovia sp. MM14-A1259]|uniref:three-helix bundle dimerization domain-containing protein n=1 Tax=Krasilnikovia sp. MM14-A1259 TaxID=3373539 RepID=UPI00382F2EED
MTNDAEVAQKAADAEREAIRQVVTVLQQRFPGLDDATVAGYVTDIHKRFDTARIRDFVPLLVEREAGRALTRLTDETIPAPRQQSE